LSFFGYGGQRIHRLGVALRADVLRERTWSIFGEAGAAKKWGLWRVDDMIGDYTSDQNEVHGAVGLALFDAPNRAAWHLALRYGVGRRDPVLATACRGTCSSIGMSPETGLAESLMLEWTWMMNR
jgi:hypothetical protein